MRRVELLYENREGERAKIKINKNKILIYIYIYIYTCTYRIKKWEGRMSRWGILYLRPRRASFTIITAITPGVAA